MNASERSTRFKARRPKRSSYCSAVKTRDSTVLDSGPVHRPISRTSQSVERSRRSTSLEIEHCGAKPGVSVRLQIACRLAPMTARHGDNSCCADLEITRTDHVWDSMSGRFRTGNRDGVSRTGPRVSC